MSCLIDIGLLIVFTAVLLRITGFGARTGQTLTALAGSGVILNLIALPIVIWSIAARSRGTPSVTADLGHTALLVWSILISAHIYRHALSTQFLVGVLVTVLCLCLILATTMALIPDPGTGLG